MDNVIQKLYSSMDNSRILQCIRSGLIMMIPIMMIGSFALMFRSLPITAYQQFITTVFSGAIYEFLSFIHTATFGFLAVYMTVSVSISYARQYMPTNAFGYGPLFTSLNCFFIFSGVLSGDFSKDALGANGMFTGIVCALAASALYCEIKKRLPRLSRLYTDGVDGEFKSAISAIVPTLLVIMVFALLNLVFVRAFHGREFQALFTDVVNQAFGQMGNSLGTSLLYVLLSSVLWFFGIHGENLLATVNANLFTPALETNLSLVESGKEATEIFCKPFFDVFVVMGGCGTTLCLLLAILLFSKRRSDRNLARTAALPILFNINEIMIFGLPVVFNPILLIPFLVTPLVMVLTSSLAMYLGLVPMPIANVGWTTPVLLGGYLVTGSISGAVLQIVNIIIGVFIYRPFIHTYDKVSEWNAKHRMEKLLKIFKQSEEQWNPIELLGLRDSLGGVSRTLAEDFTYRIQNQLPTLFYQPQYSVNGECIGVEALLRWEHPLYGTIYPPMIIKLAEETGQLAFLEKSIYKSVMKDMDRLLQVLGEDTKVSVNVSGITIQTNDFEEFLSELYQKNPEACRHICIELTEQTALQINDTLIGRLSRIHSMGYSLAIDDFSMGSTSIKYLQTSVFDIIKLDGSLSSDIVHNPRSLEIVSSISTLSNTFEISVLAEYVETEEQRAMLEEAGCKLYQGYLYSSAVPLEKLSGVLRRNRKPERVE